MGWFTPAWQTKNEDKALIAVEKTIDQTKLATIAKNALLYNVRIEALRKLTDHAVLNEIAQKDKNAQVRLHAVDMITDQSILTHVAMNDKVDFVRSSAVAKLTDQSILAKIATKDNDYIVRRAAIYNLTDQSIITYVAMNDNNSDVRVRAVEKITDQSIIVDIAKSDTSISGYTAWLKIENAYLKKEIENSQVGQEHRKIEEDIIKQEKIRKKLSEPTPLYMMCPRCRSTLTMNQQSNMTFIKCKSCGYSSFST
jgi:translation initiation factor 2 beta subunit (eIF-2beta)/eIF-5